MNRVHLISMTMGLMLAMACSDPQGASTGPSTSVGEEPQPNQTQYWCETHWEECHGGEDPPGPTDPNPSAAGYWLGTTVTPAVCVSATGAGINDIDHDGMDDTCEERLAEVFRPTLNLAPSNYDCDAGKEPYWVAKPFPGQGNVVRVMYLLAYYRDCGSDGSIIITAAQWFGSVQSLNNLLPNLVHIVFGTDDPTAGHSGDSEFIVVDLLYDETSQHWSVTGMFTSAHYHTNADGSRWAYGPHGIEWGDGHIGGYPSVWVGYGKHSNYSTRTLCNAGRGLGGAAHDDCNPNAVNVERLFFSASRNLGSWHHNLLNGNASVESCAPSQDRAAFNPGVECFWRERNADHPNQNFQGWLQYGYGELSAPYHGPLMARFECYATSNLYEGDCIDPGIHRLPD